MHRLVTIRFSHFNEKARWALDRYSVPFRESGYMPGIHALGVLPVAVRFGLGRGDAFSTPFATPVLITDDGLCIRDSSSIVRYVSDRYASPGTDLYPNAEVVELDAHLSRTLGPDTRRIAYTYLGSTEQMARVADLNVGRRQARWFKLLAPLIRPAMMRKLDVSPARSARSLDDVRREMDRISARIEGRRWLVGDRFTAADLSLACLAAPVLVPSEYGGVLPPLEEMPQAFRALVAEMRDCPAGQHAMRMFREERRP
jgi:glutathione S-transferase